MPRAYLATLALETAHRAVDREDAEQVQCVAYRARQVRLLNSYARGRMAAATRG